MKVKSDRRLFWFLKEGTEIDLSDSFNRIKNFLPRDVRKFWEDVFGDTNNSTEKDTHPV